MNLTLTGELGYVMFIPSEYALHVFDAIMDAGSDLGIKHCGYYAMHALRIEKFFAFWGQASFSINQSTYGLLENQFPYPFIIGPGQSDNAFRVWQVV